MITVAVTGPESTGKTSVSEFLAGKLQGVLVPEFARKYLEQIRRPYTYDDVIFIGQTQVRQRKESEKNNPGYLILDTWLIITKVWLMEVFDRCPEWIDQAIQEQPVDIYLLCAPDIPWIPDPLRENGGERRNYLFGLYLDEIKKTGVPYEIVRGKGRTRFQNTYDIIKNKFNS